MGSFHRIILGIIICTAILYFSEIENRYFRMVDTSWEKTMCKATPGMWISGPCFRADTMVTPDEGKSVCWTKWINGACDIELDQPMTIDYTGKTIFLIGLFLILFNIPYQPRNKLVW